MPNKKEKALEVLARVYDLLSGDYVQPKDVKTALKVQNEAVKEAVRQLRGEITTAAKKIEAAKKELGQIVQRERGDLEKGVAESLAKAKIALREEIDALSEGVAASINSILEKIPPPYNDTGIWEEIASLRKAIPAEYDPTDLVERIQTLEEVTEKLKKLPKQVERVVLGTRGATDINGLSDVAVDSPSSGEYLQYDGAKWTNQAHDATLQSIAGLGTAADKMLYTTGVDTWAEATLTSFIRTLLDDADAAAARATLGAGTLDNVVEDTTPQLGGALDANQKIIGDATLVDDGNSGTSKNIDFSAGMYHKLTLTGNATLTFTNPTLKARVQLILVQGATGSNTVTWPPLVKWAGGTPPTLSTAANAVDIVTLFFDGTNYYGVASLNFA